MKLIFRADDFGYTKTFNDGTIKAIEEGVVTSVDLMMDTPGAEDALVRIKEYPWISVGWHTHFWGKPCADTKQVPSMVDEEGRFRFRKDRSSMKEVPYEEALAECYAEVEKCIRILGKVPDTAMLLGDSELSRAKQKVCDVYGIKYNFITGKNPRTKEIEVCDLKYADLKIFDFENYGKPGMTVETFHLYDPLENILQMDVTSEKIYQRSQHPGYLDDYILNESSCSIHRPKDVEVLCSEILKNWIRENNIELVNMRDALYGTKEYQNHLRYIGSDLLHCKQEEAE